MADSPTTQDVEVDLGPLGSATVTTRITYSNVTVHACPRPGEARFPCCGRWPLEHLWTARMTNDPALVTCPRRDRTED